MAQLTACGAVLAAQARAYREEFGTIKVVGAELGGEASEDVGESEEVI